MAVVCILLFIQVITGHLVLYQPPNVISAEVNSTAVIPCVSREDSDQGHQIAWYQRKWILDERPLLVKSCSSDNDRHKYTCKYEKGISKLSISNGQPNDSGVYFCAFMFVDNYIFGNGSYLNVGDRSTSRNSIHILSSLQPLRTHSFIQLACVVHEARDTIHITWNISRRQHRGRTISKRESNGIRTIMNFISLPGDNWNPGQKIICEVWILSSPIGVHWVIPEKAEIHGYLTHKCQAFLIPVLISGMLLLLTLSLHLIRTFKLKGTKGQVSMDNDALPQAEIVYTELNMAHLTRHRKS
ncbi:uncharacterized protein ACNLHF_003609 [Anomaloglossus baeobatrachus]